MTCSRVLILHEGRILAADTTQNLQKVMSDSGMVLAEIAGPVAELRACWAQMAEVEHFDVAPTEGNYWRCSLTPRAGVDLRPLVFAQVLTRGWALRELTRTQHSLEDIFVHVTRSKSDEEEG